MIENPDYSDEVKGRLLHELASMKKQSVFSLLFAIICVVVMVFLFYKLRESNRELTRAKEKLARQNDLLEDQKVVLTNFKNELDAWRMSLLEVDSIPIQLEPEVVMMPGEAAMPAGAEPVLERPTMPVQSNKPRVRSPQTSGPVQSEDNDPWVQGSLPQAVQQPSEPMVAQQAQTQHYELKKQGSASRSICFGYIIYIQDAKAREASKELQKMLKEKGAIVPAIQSRNLPRSFRTSIKYFHQEDERAAQWVSKILRGILKERGVNVRTTDIPVTYVSNAKVSLGQLEVWVGN
ncbi:hypothetical protein [Persicitalea jodogahamensis]|nr:hypothetical protein [Persicitalea jodogahamensis]